MSTTTFHQGCHFNKISWPPGGVDVGLLFSLGETKYTMFHSELTKQEQTFFPRSLITSLDSSFEITVIWLQPMLGPRDKYHTALVCCRGVCWETIRLFTTTLTDVKVWQTNCSLEQRWRQQKNEWSENPDWKDWSWYHCPGWDHNPPIWSQHERSNGRLCCEMNSVRVFTPQTLS